MIDNFLAYDTDFYGASMTNQKIFLRHQTESVSTASLTISGIFSNTTTGGPTTTANSTVSGTSGNNPVNGIKTNLGDINTVFGGLKSLGTTLNDDGKAQGWTDMAAAGTDILSIVTPGLAIIGPIIAGVNLISSFFNIGGNSTPKSASGPTITYTHGTMQLNGSITTPNTMYQIDIPFSGSGVGAVGAAPGYEEVPYFFKSHPGAKLGLFSITRKPKVNIKEESPSIGAMPATWIFDGMNYAFTDHQTFYYHAVYSYGRLYSVRVMDTSILSLVQVNPETRMRIKSIEIVPCFNSANLGSLTNDANLVYKSAYFDLQTNFPGSNTISLVLSLQDDTPAGRKSAGQAIYNAQCATIPSIAAPTQAIQNGLRLKLYILFESIDNPNDTVEVIKLVNCDISYDADNGPYPSIVPARIALKANVNNKYVSIDNVYGGPLMSNRASAGSYETFYLQYNDDGTVSLKNVYNLYVTMMSNGADTLKANRTARVKGDWDNFVVINNTNNTISLSNTDDGNFVSVDPATGTLRASDSTVSTWNEFYIITNSDNSISLQSYGNSLYVAEDNYNAQILYAGCNSISQSIERFYVSTNSDNSISLQNQYNNLYVCAESTGKHTLIASQTTINDYNEFYLTSYVRITIFQFPE